MADAKKKKKNTKGGNRNKKKKITKKKQVVQNRNKKNSTKKSNTQAKKKNTSKKTSSSKGKQTTSKANTKKTPKKSTVATKKTTKASVKPKSKTASKSAVKKNDKKSKVEESKSKLKVNKRALLLISLACLILALLLLFPYGVKTYKSGASGKNIEVPRLSKLKSECCMFNAEFTSIRSASVLKQELNKMMNSYEKLACDGKEYYYNEKGDYTVTDYGVKRGLIFNEVYITYGVGNSCEIDTTFRKLELLPNDYTIEESIKEGYYTITENKIYNEEKYEEFLNAVEQKEETTFRVVKNNSNGYLVILDLKYLSNGEYKVIFDGTRDPSNQDGAMMAYNYDNIGIYKNKLYAYNGNKVTESSIKSTNAYYIIDVAEETEE